MLYKYGLVGKTTIFIKLCCFILCVTHQLWTLLPEGWNTNWLVKKNLANLFLKLLLRSCWGCEDGSMAKAFALQIWVPESQLQKPYEKSRTQLAQTPLIPVHFLGNWEAKTGQSSEDCGPAGLMHASSEHNRSCLKQASRQKLKAKAECRMHKTALRYMLIFHFFINSLTWPAVKIRRITIFYHHMKTLSTGFLCCV